MTKISKDLLRGIVDEGFFDNQKYIKETVERLDQKGKKISLLSQLLAFLCQEGLLEREKDENGEWKYKRV